ncbi:OsmC family peroxiredoxin [Georgenia sp. 311]|uniref:OsmC family peroxiredoxin n=1 Tax=Georgenia wutianyii TaxID=2585135 RepID=A0ABX5VR05_9MICO|nr:MULTISPECIES: OsmC family peroxiredoxin [Georgenia]QDB78970.1 OsmC family peroxiredoxin [Georgenia wutianyii]TNC17221.1 OsmC family peroxiredoxin [Georgenia sp. 311]
MPNPVVNKASTEWKGELFTGSGTTSLDTSGTATFDVAWKSRGEESGGTTTPEELIAAAHATCYAMQLSNMLKENGTPPTALDTSAAVTFVAGTGITGIELTVSGTVEGIDAGTFDEIARKAKETCPVSQALSAVEITLSDVRLA